MYICVLKPPLLKFSGSSPFLTALRKKKQSSKDVIPSEGVFDT